MAKNKETSFSGSGKKQKADERGDKRKNISLRPKLSFFSFTRYALDNRLKELIRRAQEQGLDKLIEHYDELNENDRKRLDLIRFAFSLLKSDFGIIDFSKINPLLVLAISRAACFDGFPNDPKRFQDMILKEQRVMEDKQKAYEFAIAYVNGQQSYTKESVKPELEKFMPTVAKALEQVQRDVDEKKRPLNVAPPKHKVGAPTLPDEPPKVHKKRPNRLRRS